MDGGICSTSLKTWPHSYFPSRSVVLPPLQKKQPHSLIPNQHSLPSQQRCSDSSLVLAIVKRLSAYGCGQTLWLPNAFFAPLYFFFSINHMCCLSNSHSFYVLERTVEKHCRCRRQGRPSKISTKITCFLMSFCSLSVTPNGIPPTFLPSQTLVW